MFFNHFNFNQRVFYNGAFLVAKLIFFSCPGSVNAGKLILSADENGYFVILPELIHVVRILHLFWIFLVMTDHQYVLHSTSTFFEPECPRCNASTAGLFISSVTTILSPANSKPNLSVILLDIGETSRGILSFRSFRLHVFCCNEFRLTEVLRNKVFRSIMKLKLVFFYFYPFGCSSWSFFYHIIILDLANPLNLFDPRWENLKKILPQHLLQCLILVRNCSRCFPVYLFVPCLSSVLVN